MTYASHSLHIHHAPCPLASVVSGRFARAAFYGMVFQFCRSSGLCGGGLRLDQGSAFVGDGIVFQHCTCADSAFGGGAIRNMGGGDLTLGNNLLFYNNR